MDKTILWISCVNGDEIRYIQEEENKPALLAFLKLHDHEGAFINLGLYSGENVYKYLGAEV